MITSPILTVMKHIDASMLCLFEWSYLRHLIDQQWLASYSLSHVVQQ